MASECSVNDDRNNKDHTLLDNKELRENDKDKRNILINSDGQRVFCKYWVNEIASFTPRYVNSFLFILCVFMLKESINPYITVFIDH